MNKGSFISRLVIYFATACLGSTLMAFEITSGIADYQVLQRGVDGTASVTLQGRSSRAGSLRVSVVRGKHQLRLAGFADRPLARIQAGGWTARLSGLPTGGPYRLKFFVANDAGAELAAHGVEQILVGDVWVLAGQSNMVGRAELENVEKPHELVHVFRPEGGWAQAKEPLHERRERNNMVIGAGLGLPFAKEMVRRTNVPVGLIPTAVGGTSLWQWDPALKTKGRESLYGNMLAQFEASGGMARGMLWYQGESDTRLGRVEQYQERFREFVAAIRADLRRPDLPIYTAQLSRYVVTPSDRNDATWSAMREAQRQAAKTIENVGLVSAIDLGLVDLIHVDTEGLRTIGVRFAKRVCRDLYGNERGCAGLEAGPRLKEVNWEGPHRLRVKFSGVNGTLAAPGRVMGFDIRDSEENRLPLVFRAEINEPDEVLLWLIRREQAPDPAFLAYGYGMDPAANLIDQEGLAAPAFGPLLLPSRPPAPAGR